MKSLPIRGNFRIRDNALCTKVSLIKRFQCILVKPLIWLATINIISQKEEISCWYIPKASDKRQARSCVRGHALIIDHVQISQTQRASHSGAAALCAYAKFGTIVRLRAKPFSIAFLMKCAA